MVNVKEFVTENVEKLKLYWSKPPHGRYMPFKEIASLAFGGMGVKFICYAVQLMLLSVGNTLIGNTIGIPPQPLYLIYIISIIVSFPLTAIRAKMVDSAKNGKGRFRPYIFTMAIPTVILALGFTWMPYDKMTLLWKCFTVLMFNIGFQFFYTFMFDSYTNIINVLSPNTYERSDVCSVTAVTDSFAPTIIGFIMPLLARAITGENTIYDMKIYRVVFPPILLVGLLLTILIHVNTEEKVIEAKTHVIKIGFMDALRAVSKNKYFWIISCASWIGFLESSFGTILAWLYNYQEACTPLQYSIVTAVYGNSSLWSMIFAPVLIRKIGKRNLLLYSNLMSIFFILCMYPVVTGAPKSMIIWLMLGCMFINGLGTSLGNLLQYSLNGDIRDYQQYLTGERIDGMFFTIGLIGSVVGMVTGSVLPAIYNWAGLNETVAKSLGYDGSNVYYVLYDPDYFKRICGVLVIASAIGAALNAIPYFFYDLTEVKQKAMVRVLKIRALFEDYGNNALSDENLIEAIDLIDEAYEYYEKEAVKPDKSEIKAAKRLKDKSAVKAAKEKYKEQKEINEKIIIGRFIVKEVEKFDSPAMKIQIERANKIVAAGLDGLRHLNTITVKQARKLPKGTPDEKEIRKFAIENARTEKSSKKAFEDNYSDGISEFDSDIFGELFRQEDSLDLEIRALIDDYRKANEQKDKSKANDINAEIKVLRKKKYGIQKEIKRFTEQYSVYNRAAKPYIDAKKLLIQQENYRRYDEIKANYEESKVRAEAQRAEKEEAEKREKAEKEAYAAKLREERKAKKNKLILKG